MHLWALVSILNMYLCAKCAAERGSFPDKPVNRTHSFQHSLNQMLQNNSRHLSLTTQHLAQCTQENHTVTMQVQELTVVYAQHREVLGEPAGYNRSLSSFTCWINVTTSDDHVLKVQFLEQTCSQDNFLSVKIQVSDSSEYADRRSGCEDLMSPLLMDWVSRRHFLLLAIVVHNPRLPFVIKVKVTTVTSHTKTQLQLYYLSSTMGLAQSPGWHPTAGVNHPQLAGIIDSTLSIRIPRHHVMMNSFLYISLHRSVYQLRFYLTKDSLGKDPDLLNTGMQTIWPTALGVKWQKPLDPFIFPFSPDPVMIVFQVGKTTQSLPGFRLLFTFHPHHKRPARSPQGQWNCSVDTWPSFQSHLACNMVTQCLDGRDEEDCGYTRCERLGFEVKGRCYILRFWSGAKGSTGPADECAKEGAQLVSLNTMDEYRDVTRLLWKYQEFPMFVGLQSTPRGFPNIYRRALMWADQTILYSIPFKRYRSTRFVKCGITCDCFKEKLIPRNDWSRSVYASSCNDSSPTALLCEYNDRKSSSSFPVKIRSELRYKQGMSDARLMFCPSNHSTREFLTCDGSSHCWGRHPVSFGDRPETWDIPSASTCPMPTTPLPPSYSCQRGSQRVPYSLLCDHHQHCADNSDEDFCVHKPCLYGYRCGESKQCFSGAKSLCDLISDCWNGYDEKYCKTSCLILVQFDRHLRAAVIQFHEGYPHFNELHRWGKKECPESTYLCPKGYCLPVFTRCNGVLDCPEGQDEERCELYECPDFYRCRGSSICLHPYQVCDGQVHCQHYDDELLCRSDCPNECTCFGTAFTCPHSFYSPYYPSMSYLKAEGSGMNLKQLTSNMMLVYLSLASCQLSVIGNISFPNIATLDLRDNHIFSLTGIGHGLPNLKALFLSNNPLSNSLHRDISGQRESKDLPFEVFAHVNTLDLSGISLPTINGRVGGLFPSVRRLNLSGCGTQHVTEPGLQLMTQLQTLDMTGCPMQAIHKDTLKDLVHLTMVSGDYYKLCCAASLIEGFDSNNCYAPMDEISSCNDLLRSNVYRAALAILASLAILGNLVSGMFRGVTIQQRGLSGFGVFVIHLCVSDFLMGLYLAIIGVADKIYQHVYVWEDVSWRHSAVCQLAGFLSLLSSEVSAFIVCLITLDRILVVRFPLSFLRFQSNHAQVASVGCWVIGILLAGVPSSPITAHWNFYSQTGICIPLPITRKQFSGQEYGFAIMIVLNFILFVIIALGQIVILHSIRANELLGKQMDQRSKDDAIARRLFTIAMSDFLCWFPIGLLGILSIHGVPVSGEVNVAMAIFMLPLNAAINPFLYTMNLLMEKQRKAKEDRLLQWLQIQTEISH